ncbi:MAG TPA: glycosyl hydrolase-related protein, partial [Acidimicrobiia bacterium]
ADGGPGYAVVVDHPGVQLSALKLADDGSGDVIVRLFEAVGDRADVGVLLPWAIASAERVNLLEDPGEPVGVIGGAARLTMRPFELVTLRLRR